MKKMAAPGLTVLAGLAFFWWVLGRYGIVPPSHVDWMLTGDWFKHYTEWLYYLREPWSWPLVRVCGLMIPVGSSTTELDTIPLGSLVFKSIFGLLRGSAPVLPQFFGIWLMLCYVLQGIFGYAIFRELRVSKHFAVIGGLFLVTSPLLYFRIGQVALCSHFLILAGFWLYIRSLQNTRQSTRRFSTAGWAGLFCAAASIQPYLLAMVLPLAIALVLTLRTRQAAMGITCAFGTLAGVAWVLGYFGIREATASDFSGYAADLLTFVNSMDHSRVLRHIRAAWGAYEGFAYLGIATLGLLVYWLLRRSRFPNIRLSHDYRALRWVLLLMACFALSGKIAFGGNVILDLSVAYHWLEPLPSTFRTSGRFIWPMYYGITIFALLFAMRTLGNSRRALVLMTTVLALQIWEFSPWYAQFSKMISGSPARAHEATLAARYSTPRAILFVANGSPDDFSQPCRPFAGSDEVQQALFLFAADRGIPINIAFAGRTPWKQVDPACRAVKREVRADHLEQGTLYVLEQDASHFPSDRGVRCDEFLNVRLCIRM